MGLQTLELTLISAKDLKNVNLIGKMDVYVVVYLSENPNSKQKTPVHQDGGANPSWNYTMRFTVDDATAAAPGKYLIFKFKHEHTFGADKDLGEVLVPLNDLFHGTAKGSDSRVPQLLTYQVRTSSGKAKGEFKFSCKFIDSDLKNPNQSSCSSSSAHSTTVYPPPAAPYPPSAVPYAAPAGHGYPPYGGYPPPPQPGYGYPPPGGYGYPPAGYPQVVQQAQKPKKNSSKFGMGLGAGLIGGALGGLVLGEMVDDVYDAGYDTGFDDSGFDF